MANTNPFEIALDAARKALTAALEERSAIEQRIVSLKQTIDGLSALCEPESDEDLVQVQEGDQPYSFKLTDAIRLIFSATSEPMLTPTEVRDALVANGLDLSKYKQPLVPIHNTLKRLTSQGELVEFRDDKGDLRGYRWVSPLARAVAEVSNSPELKTKWATAVGQHPVHNLRNRAPK
jgi:hypothetical protein